MNRVMKMDVCNPLALTTGINTLAVTLACQLGDEELELAAAVLTQLGDTLTTIAVQRALCAGQTSEV